MSVITEFMDGVLGQTASVVTTACDEPLEGILFAGDDRHLVLTSETGRLLIAVDDVVVIAVAAPG